MIVSILAGGLGTRLQEETVIKPKPMIEIGGRPILWHIMKIYASFGFREFVIALGYKGEVIKDYFLNYRQLSKDLTISLTRGEIKVHNGECEDWTIHLIDTGLSTQIGGRVKRLAQYIGKQPFMLTYGDGLSNINITDLLTFHQQHNKLATVTAVRPPARFGTIVIDGHSVTRFEEKPQGGEGWINGGFFVLEPGIVDYIENDETVFEHEPLANLSRDGQLNAFQHNGFWQCLDTIRDLRLLENLWQTNHAPWKVW